MSKRVRLDLMVNPSAKRALRRAADARDMSMSRLVETMVLEQLSELVNDGVDIDDWAELKQHARRLDHLEGLLRDVVDYLEKEHDYIPL